MTEHSMGNKTACASLLIWHSSISLCRFRHLIKCICSSPPAVCPSCWWERTPGGTDSSLKLTDSITEPNKDRRMDQNSITFKDGRGMFAGESHHTFQFSLLHVEVSEPEVLWLLLMTGHAFNQTQRERCVSVITYSSHATLFSSWDHHWRFTKKMNTFQQEKWQNEKQSFTSHWPPNKWWKHFQLRLNTVKISKRLDLTFLMHAYCAWFTCANFPNKNICNLL